MYCFQLSPSGASSQHWHYNWCPNFQANHGEIHFLCLFTIKSLNNNIKRILGTHTGRSTSASILEPCSSSYPLFFSSAESKTLDIMHSIAKQSIFSNTCFSISFTRLALNFHEGGNTVKTLL